MLNRFRFTFFVNGANASPNVTADRGHDEEGGGHCIGRLGWRSGKAAVRGRRQCFLQSATDASRVVNSNQEPGARAQRAVFRQKLRHRLSVWLWPPSRFVSFGSAPSKKIIHSQLELKWDSGREGGREPSSFRDLSRRDGQN